MSPLQPGPVRDLLALVKAADQGPENGASEAWLQERTGTGQEQLRRRLHELAALHYVIAPREGDLQRRWHISAQGLAALGGGR